MNASEPWRSDAFAIDAIRPVLVIQRGTLVVFGHVEVALVPDSDPPRYLVGVRANPIDRATGALQINGNALHQDPLSLQLKVAVEFLATRSVNAPPVLVAMAHHARIFGRENFLSIVEHVAIVLADLKLWSGFASGRWTASVGVIEGVVTKLVVVAVESANVIARRAETFDDRTRGFFGIAITLTTFRAVCNLFAVFVRLTYDVASVFQKRWLIRAIEPNCTSSVDVLHVVFRRASQSKLMLIKSLGQANPLRLWL